MYLIYGDVPNNWTIASCTLLVASLLVHEIAGMMSSGEDHKTTLEPVRASPLKQIPLRGGPHSISRGCAKCPVLRAPQVRASRVSGSGKKKSGLSEPLNP